MTNHAQQLREKINDRSALVGIIGLGYVGLPLALAFAEKGFNVLGFDTDPAKVDKINRGESYIKHLDPTRLARATGHAPAVGVAENSQLSTLNSQLLSATADFSRLSETDAILICVPTPLGPHKEPDLQYVESSAHAIQKTLRPGQLVILESTTYPGTTDDLLKPILESPLGRRQTSPSVISTEGAERPSGEICADGKSEISDDVSDGKSEIRNSKFEIKCGTHFFLAFSPEREDPGNPDFGTKNIPKVVGGVEEISGDLAEALYAQVLDSTVRVRNARTAEATKLMENVFRAVNIALVNELKMVFEKMGVDIWDVLDAAETKPFGFMRFNPGPGWGGHCIGLDPFYLAWKARESGQRTGFIELAGDINIEMPKYVIEKLTQSLNERGKSVKGAKILVLGLAYKPDIDDPRESPAFEIIDRLLALGAEVSYHDPHIPVAPSMRSWPGLPPMESQALTEESLQSVDAALLITDHKNVDYDLVLEHAPLLIDTRGVYRDHNGKVHPA